MAQTYILGISAFYHDSAACLLRDGEIVAAARWAAFDGISIAKAGRILRVLARGKMHEPLERRICPIHQAQCLSDDPSPLRCLARSQI
jgi:hypothetical protein